MKDKISVLVYPCGAENALEIHSALKDNVNIKLYGASGKEDHGKFLFKSYFGNFPYITDIAFIDYLSVIIDEHNIDVIIPTHEDVSLFLAQNADKINAKIAVPGLRQAQICRSKKLQYQIFESENFCPKVFETIKSINRFPVFVKPDKGQGGKGSFLAENIDLAILSKAFTDEYVITEYLPGEEIAVDCFTDRHGKLRFVGAFSRNRISGGFSRNSVTIPLTKEIEFIANKVSEKIRMRGVWSIQLMKNANGQYKLLEIAVRAASTMNLYRGLGINFPLLTVYDLMNYDVEILKNDYTLEVDRALFNRYMSNLEYDTIYIDFDNTVIKDGKVNPFVIFFLYHLKNRNKTLKLIVTNVFDLHETFKKLIIPAALFDEIVLLRPNEIKYKKITESNNVIYIDSAYTQRAEVRKNLNIPVFDIDALSTLIDWRE